MTELLPHLPLGAPRNNRLNEIAAGFVASDGTRFAILSEDDYLRPGRPLQLAVLSPGKKPTFYDALVSRARLLSSDDDVIQTAIGTLFSGAVSARITGPHGNIALKIENRSDDLRRLGLAPTPSISPRP
jgi:hypothetical protein